VTLLVGEPGIGKTRTAGEVADLAATRGVRVLTGACNEGEQTPAYGPWAAALGSYARSAPATELPVVVGPGAGEVLSLVPELRKKARSSTDRTRSPASDARPWLFERLAACLDSLSRPSGLLVVLDNIQWSDPDSLRFLEYATRELSASPIMILCTAREPELSLDHPATRALGEIVKMPSYRRVHLPGLDPADVGAYLKRALGRRSGPALTEELHRRSGGNPLFMIELVRAARDLRQTNGGDLPVPAGVRDAIGRRLARLPTDCRSVLSLASVIGRVFQTAVLQRLQPRHSTAHVQDLLRQAAEQGFIDERLDGGASWQFTHALVQETLADSLPSARRASIHDSIADAIEKIHGEAPGPHVHELLRHRVEAGPAGGTEGIAQAAVLCARRSREQCAPELAVRELGPALSAVESAPSSPSRRREAALLLYLLAQALDDLGNPRASEYLVRSYDLYESLGERRKALEVALCPTHRSIAFWGALMSVPMGLNKALRVRALALVKPGSRDEGRLRAQFWNPKDMKRALAIARRCRDVSTQIWCLTGLANWYELSDGPELSGPYRTQGMRLRDRCADPAAVHHLLERQSMSLLTWGDLVGAREAARDALRNAQEARSRRILWGALCLSAMVEAMAGEWDACRRLAEQMLSMPSDQPVVTRVVVLQTLTVVEAETGHPDAGQRWLAQAGAVAPGAERCPFILARLALITGDRSKLGEVAMTLGPAVGALPTPYDEEAAEDQTTRATIAILQDDRRAAASLEGYFRKYRGAFGPPGPTGRCFHGVLAQLCACAGKLDEAAGHFENALAFCSKAGYRPELAWTHLFFADLLVRRAQGGDAQRAATLLADGMVLAKSLGMEPLLGKMDALYSVRYTDHPAIPLLSPRETEVVRLVAGGLTNREIGEKLSISEHTAAKHVQNILVKTGMSNRAEVSAFAASRGLLDS
jgi:DNA-binding CsgD family transcriptional regulator